MKARITSSNAEGTTRPAVRHSVKLKAVEREFGTNAEVGRSLPS